MKIHFAVDVLDNACVRLRQGRFADVQIFSFNPLNVVQQFASHGFTSLHLVDLNGARNGGFGLHKLIKKIRAQFAGHMQVAGGIRSEEQVAELLEMGVNRVVIGSLAANHPEKAEKMIQRFGEDRITIGLDVRNGKVQVEGWEQEASRSFYDLLDFFSPYSGLEFLISDIERDGMMAGSNRSLYRQILKKYPALKIQASGGINDDTDLDELKDVGTSSAIVGRYFLEKYLAQSPSAEPLFKEVI